MNVTELVFVVSFFAVVLGVLGLLVDLNERRERRWRARMKK